MHRMILVAASLGVMAWSAHAADPPPLGKSVEIETEAPPKGKGGEVFKGDKSREVALPFRHEFTLPMEQGDKFKFEVGAVKGAKMLLKVEVFTADGQRFASSPIGAAVNWKMTQGAPGDSIKVIVRSNVAGKILLLVDHAAGKDGESAELKRLRAENAKLKKQVDELRQELDELKKKK